MKLKKIVAALVALVVGMLGAVVISSSARAETPAVEVVQAKMDPTCPVTYICLHTGVFWSGTTFVADPWALPENTCFNFNSFWNDNVNSLWYNESDTWYTGSYAEMYENANCTGAVIARAWAGSSPLGQMRSCNEVAPWDGPCGPPNNVAKRASSWAFDLN